MTRGRFHPVTFLDAMTRSAIMFLTALHTAPSVDQILTLYWLLYLLWRNRVNLCFLFSCVGFSGSLVGVRARV